MIRTFADENRLLSQPDQSPTETVQHERLSRVYPPEAVRIWAASHHNRNYTESLIWLKAPANEPGQFFLCSRGRRYPTLFQQFAVPRMVIRRQVGQQVVLQQLLLQFNLLFDT